MAQNEAIGLHFKVADNTATELQKQLNTVVSEINKAPFEIQFTYDKKQLDEMKKAIKDIDSITSKSNKRTDVQKDFVSGIKSATKQAEKILNKPLEIGKNKQAFENLRKNIEGAYESVMRYKKASQDAFDGEGVKRDAEEELLKLKQYIDQYNNLSTQTKNDTKHQKSLQNTSLTYDKLINKLTQYYTKYKALISTSPQHIAQYDDLLSMLRGKNFDSVQAAAQAVQQFTIDIRDAGLETETLGQHLKRVFGQKLEYGALATAALYARQLATEIYKNVRAIDTAMTELRKVTDETEATYSRFLDSAADRAQNLGAKLTDVINSTADFARLGYNIDDASTLSDVATVYKNVGDGIEDISTASESIISTMQAFGIAASDAMSIVDKFNEVGNNFAVSSSGVGEILVRSASAMAAANNTLEQTIALGTAANTVVQDPDKVGTALRSVSMFLRAAKTEAEEAGESTDGMADSVSELREEILSLTGGKVDIQIDEDTFKSTYDIIKELSQVWDELTDVTQANILEMIGGKRNSNITSALIEGFSVAEEALATASDASGSALAENEKYLDSIAGKTSKLSASFQAMSNTVLDSDLVKGFIDLLNVSVQLIDKLAEMNALLPMIAAGFAAFKTVGRPKYEGFHECAHVSSGGDAERVYALIVA